MEQQKPTPPQWAVKALKSVFISSNFTTQWELRRTKLTAAKWKQVTGYYNIETSYDSVRGIISLWRDNKPMERDEIQNL